MSSLLLVLLSSVLVTTMVLAHVPQWRPFLGPITVFDSARLMAAILLAAVPAAAMPSWLLASFVLRPAELDYLQTPAFVAIILIVVPLTNWLLRRRTRLVPSRPGFALVMSSNTAMLGIALIAEMRARSVIDALLFTLGAAVASSLLLLAFAALYERIRHADVPAAFREAPLALVTAGIMALAFMGFTGLIQE